MTVVDGLLGPEEPELGCDDCFAELDRSSSWSWPAPTPTPTSPASAPTWPAAWPAGRSTRASAPSSPATRLSPDGLPAPVDRPQHHFARAARGPAAGGRVR